MIKRSWSTSWFTAAFWAGLSATVPLAPAFAWTSAYGDATNTGYADATTVVATKPAAVVHFTDSVGVSSGPVIGPEGNVYFGTQQGRLMALHSDGSTAWTRQLAPNYAVKAAPTVSVDGSIYVVGQSAVTDNRVQPPVFTLAAELFKFSPAGTLLWATPFPLEYATFPAFRNRGATSAPPQIWRDGSSEAVIVPAIYHKPGGFDLDLVAIRQNGALAAKQIVRTVSDTITADDDLLDWSHYVFGFSPSIYHPADLTERLDSGLSPAMPGVAIYARTKGATPQVVAVDGQHDTIGYAFSPTSGFSEIWRNHDSVTKGTAPVILANGSVIVASVQGVAFGGQPPVFQGIVPLGYYYSAATAATSPNFQTVVMGEEFGANVLQGGTFVGNLKADGESLASPTITKNHIYLSTAGSLWTFDPHMLTQQARFRWAGGGIAAPAIDATGRIYALTLHDLYIFAAPIPCRICAIGPIQVGTIHAAN